MIGTNHMVLNGATVALAIQRYLNNERIRSDLVVRALHPRRKGQNWTYEIVVERVEPKK